MTGKTGPAIYICGTDPLCEPCRMAQHRSCSLDGCPDCECTHCTAEHKEHNRVALDEAIGTGYDDAGNPVCEECRTRLAEDYSCPNGCHPYVPTDDDTGECVRCLADMAAP